MPPFNHDCDELNPLQIFLLVLVKFGLTTPYDLLSKAGLGAGLTSPALKRLQEAGLLSSTAGPRRRLRYVITLRGEDVLSIMLAQTNYWRSGKTYVFESLPRSIVLAWLHSDSEEASRGVARAASKIRALSENKAREAAGLRGAMHRLQADIASKDLAADEGMLIATAYQWIKAESDAALFRLQAEAIEEIRPLLEELPPAPPIPLMQDVVMDEAIGDRRVQILKTYDAVYAREVFDVMDVEALKFLIHWLDIEALTTLGSPDFADTIWQAMDRAREDRNNFSYFVVTLNTPKGEGPVFVSSDLPGAQMYAQDLVRMPEQGFNR